AKRCPNSSKLGYALMPGEVKRVVSLGGQGISVSAYSTKRDEALAFLKWFSSEQTQFEWVKLGAASARKSVLASKTFIDATPYNRYFADSFALARDFWTVPDYATLLAVEQEYLNRAVTGKMTARAALAEIARRQQTIIERASRVNR
ncbi:MAG: extracellular solute-binding protein, partial [Candidatus Binataceae bacterium]